MFPGRFGGLIVSENSSRGRKSGEAESGEFEGVHPSASWGGGLERVKGEQHRIWD
jgi:hypothetical protein